MESLTYHPAARAEARDAAEHYDSCEAGLGARFLRVVDETAARLVEHPRTWRTFDGPWRRIMLRGFPYAFVYRVDDGGVFVAAVMHMHRRTGYWRRRER